MAQMIPERLPARASRGEERLFDILKKLPDDCLVYYEPVVADRYPDFVVILPSLGVFVIEVKGWYLGWIEDADQDRVVLRENGSSVRKEHPRQQARKYQFQLMDQARKLSVAKVLLHAGGDRAGNFLFPFCHFALMTNITRNQLEKSEKLSVRGAFSSHRDVTRDVLEIWETLTGTELMLALKAQFDPYWPIEPLNEAQMNALRAVIHPDILISSSAQNGALSDQDSADWLKVLDLQQEREARNIRSGHRIVRGVAGSSKTVLMLSRGKLLAGEGGRRVLMLCYNKPLAAYLRSYSADYPNLTIKHFHDWGGSNGIPYRDQEPNEDFGARLLRRLERGEGDAGQFDAVLIDEYQDFACSWFKCAKLALKDPEDGDLLIVGDASQALYTQGEFTWADAGIHARGRSTVLRLNYRNTKEILSAAASFAVMAPVGEEDDFGHRVTPSLENCRRHGPRVELVQCQTFSEEIEKAADLVKSWIEGGSGARPRFRPSEIAVLCRRMDKKVYRDAIGRLQSLVAPYPVVRISGKVPEGTYVDPGIKISTIHGAKGLQFPAIILLWADMLPLQIHGVDELSERNLMYVALTRAERVLVVSHSTPSTFVDELRGNLRLGRSETVLGQAWLPGHETAQGHVPPA